MSTDPARASLRPSVAVAQFAIAGLVALVLVVLATRFASRRAGTDEAIRDAREQAVIFGEAVVAPTVPRTLSSLDPDAIRAVDDVVRAHVLSSSLVRVKIWEASGRIVYSDETRLIGGTFELGDEERTTLREGGVEAEVSDLARPENRFESPAGKLLEVYLPIETANSEPLLFEVYFRFDEVNSSAGRIRGQFMPILTAGLLLFELVQLPLAWRLATQIHRARRDRERLLQNAVDASMLERRRIASDLHDGVVQQLAGVAFGLAGLADRAAVEGRPEDSTAIDEVAGETRSAIGGLRSLLVEIYPPNLRDAGLTAALEGLTASLVSRGVDVHLDVALPDQLDERSEALVFRVAQELLRNVAHHANARSVRVTLRRVDDRVTLEVVDDGVGYQSHLAQTAHDEGHVGLRLVDDLAAEVGGRFSIDARPGGGTDARLEVPIS